MRKHISACILGQENDPCWHAILVKQNSWVRVLEEEQDINLTKELNSKATNVNYDNASLGVCVGLCAPAHDALKPRLTIVSRWIEMMAFLAMKNMKQCIACVWVTAVCNS